MNWINVKDKHFAAKYQPMNKEDIEYLKDTLQFSLDKGTFTEKDTEHLYSAVCNSINVLEQFETNKLKPSDKDLISIVKQNLKEINKDEKITDYNFDLGYSLGFLDGNDFSRQIPELTLDQAIEKVKPNMDKIKDVDAHLNEIE